MNPTRLRFWHGVGKANHTKSLKKVMLAVRIHEGRKSVEIKRSMLVRDFELFERRLFRYKEMAELPEDGQLEQELKVMSDVSASHSTTLQALDEHL